MEKTITPEDVYDSSPQPQQAANDLREAAGDKAKHLKQSAVEKAQQFREFAGTKASDLTQTAKEKAQHMKQTASNQVKCGQQKARAAHADAEDYIRKNPTKSVLTALGVGVVIGLIIRR